MAATLGRTDSGVAQRLVNQPHRFRFFQAVRLLRLLDQPRRRARKDAGRNAIRFRTNASLEFPASELQGLVSRASGDESVGSTYEMTVNFMGLTGPSGVLPHHYTETFIAGQTMHREALVDGDFAPHKFFDLFSHRAVSLFHRAWEKYRFWIRVERGDRGAFTRNLLDIVGVGTRSLRSAVRATQDKALTEDTVAYYAGLLSHRPHSAAALCAVLSDYLGVAVSVAPFRGRWLRIPETDRSRLGSASCVIGEGVVLGDRAWDHQSSLRVRIGPLDRRTFESLLPDGRGHRTLQSLLKLFTGVALDADVQLVLRKEDVPACRFAPTNGLCLGYSCWLGAKGEKPFARDVDDAVFAI